VGINVNEISAHALKNPGALLVVFTRSQAPKVLLSHVVFYRILSFTGLQLFVVSRCPPPLAMATSTKTPNGMLPIPASATKKPVLAARPPKTQGRAGLPKLRLIVRRLPPGLTEEEFQTALGDEWKVGAGKVDWAAYKVGKISKE
jgi:hypothetical protein